MKSGHVDGHAPALGEHGDDADQRLGQEPLLQLALHRAHRQLKLGKFVFNTLRQLAISLQRTYFISPSPTLQHYVVLDR